MEGILSYWFVYVLVFIGVEEGWGKLVELGVKLSIVFKRIFFIVFYVEVRGELLRKDFKMFFIY